MNIFKLPHTQAGFAVRVILGDFKPIYYYFSNSLPTFSKDTLFLYRADLTLIGENTLIENTYPKKDIKVIYLLGCANNPSNILEAHIFMSENNPIIVSQPQSCRVLH